MISLEHIFSELCSDIRSVDEKTPSLPSEMAPPKGFFGVGFCIFFWLVVSTPLKNISQIGHLPQILVKIKNI